MIIRPLAGSDVLYSVDSNRTKKNSSDRQSTRYNICNYTMNTWNCKELWCKYIIIESNGEIWYQIVSLIWSLYKEIKNCGIMCTKAFIWEYRWLMFNFCFSFFKVRMGLFRENHTPQTECGPLQRVRPNLCFLTRLSNKLVFYILKRGGERN